MSLFALAAACWIGAVAGCGEHPVIEERRAAVALFDSVSAVVPSGAGAADCLHNADVALRQADSLSEVGDYGAARKALAIAVVHIRLAEVSAESLGATDGALPVDSLGTRN